MRRNALLWSDETYRMFGIARGTSLTYEAFLAAVHPDDRAYVDRKWAAALRGDPYDVEHRILVEGELKWVRERAELEWDDQGALCGGFGTVQDITERKQVEAALTAQKRLLEAILDQAADGILVRDASGVVLFANAVMKRRARLPVEGTTLAVGGTVWGKTTDGAGRALPVEQWPISRALRGETVHAVELHRTAADATSYVFLNSAAPVRNDSGEIIAAVAIDADITALKQTEDRLRQALREKEAALADKETLIQEVHHRTKNNLQMLCSLRELQADAIESPEGKQALELSTGRIYAIARLYEELYRSMSSGEVVLCEYLRGLGQNFSGMSNVTGIRFELPAEDPISVEVDRAIPCGLIVNELLTNAVKHAFASGSRGVIGIGLERIGDQIQLRVWDNGRGLPPELDLLTAPSLGLRLVRILAQQLRAEVTMESRGGAVFTLTFPLRAALALDPRRG